MTEMRQPVLIFLVDASARELVQSFCMQFMRLDALVLKDTTLTKRLKSPHTPCNNEVSALVNLLNDYTVNSL